MIKGNLFVERTPDHNHAGEPCEEDWGWIALSCTPKEGDHIRVWKDLDFQIVKVRSVMHRAVTLPLPELGQQEPTIWILASWETIDLTGYADR